MSNNSSAARLFRDLPIRQKLMVIIMVTSGVGLVLAGAGIILADYILFRDNLNHDLSTLSRIIADNSTAAVAFNDPQVAGETLAALRARRHIVAACVTRADDGTVFATYMRAGTSVSCPDPAPQFVIRPERGGLAVSQPIVQKGGRIGTLVMLYDLGEADERARLFGSTVFGVLAASSLFAFLFSSRLRAFITTPISQLARAASTVTATKDYSIRADKYSGDELGLLVDAFNEMLEGIQSRDGDLRTALLEREEALQQAHRARDFLRTTLASIGDAVIATDTTGRIVFTNPVARSLLRLAEADTLGRHLEEVFKIVNEFSREPMESPAAAVLREDSTAGMADHTILIAGDGTEIPIDDSAAPIRGAGGAIQGTVLVFRDVSARRSAEGTRRLLASIVESSDDAIMGMDLNGFFTSWNQGAERIFGYSAAEMMGRSSLAIAAPGSVDEVPEVLNRIRAGARIDQYQAARRTKSGAIIHVSITLSPVYDALGRITGASKIGRDITDQVLAAARLAQLNGELKQSNESLARSNEDLERFAFVASHDLQEPLRMITIYSQLLFKMYPPAPDPQAATYMANVLGGTTRMRALLKDLLAYSEIGATPDEPLEPVVLNLVLDKVIENLKVAIEEQGVIISWGPLPAVRAFEGHLIPLFQNIIGNAIKYRAAEPPRIQISMAAGHGEFRFAITDNGIGIEPKYTEKIFVAFKRLHGSKIPGTGIGLAICQRIVERYGGRIWVESEPGKGSTFLFTLPESLVIQRVDL